MLRDLRPSFGGKRNRKLRSGPVRTLGLPVQLKQTATRAVACLGIAAALAGGGFGVRYVLLHSGAFSLAEVRLRGAKRLEADRVAAIGKLDVGKSIFALDLAAAERAISREPWVASVKIRRELPRTVVVELVEREARVAIALGAIYLVDEHGELFKRARASELVGLPIVTGIARERYQAEPLRVRATLRHAIELDRAWRARADRDPPGELHHDGGVDLAAAFTVYFTHAGHPVGVRLGAPDETTPDRLRRLDAVLAALDQQGERPSFIHLDQRTSIDRVAVRLASASDVVQAL
jgi:cell division protein FtsQ